MSTISNDAIKRVWTQTIRYVTYRIHGLDLSKKAEDITAEAIDYALKNKRVTWDDTPASEKHLVAAAKKVAKWIIYKGIQKGKRSPISYTLDMPEEWKDGEPLEISRAESKHLVALYHAEERYKSAMEMGRLALSRLDGFLARKGVSSRDIRIFKDRVLYFLPTDVVCKKYSISPSNLYKIVCVIKGILGTQGHALVC